MIDSQAELELACRSLVSARTLGLDTEGDGLYRYRARLCTIQIAGPSRIVLVDTLALRDRTPLAALLGPSGPEKVLHDCAFDARLLAREGLPLGNVFDTAVAARFLGEVATGLSSLLEKHLGVRIGKDFQQADWGKRPLGAEELAYLEEDVRHLGALADVLRERCIETDILEEVRAESSWAARSNAEPDEDEQRPAWLRVKGAGELRTGAQRAVLRELAELRERVAQEEDVPSFRIIANPVLLVLARKLPRDLPALASFSSIARRPELAREVLEAVRRGIDAREVPLSELAILRPVAPPMEERERKKRIESALSAWRKREAEARGVNLQVVLPGHCLREIVARAPRDESELRAVSGLAEVRVERYGRALLECVAG